MNLVVIATYPTAHDAELHKVRLEQAGVEAFVDGSATADTLSIGSFLGGVKLFVADTDVAKARGALSTGDEGNPTPAWTCSECGTEVEAGYEVCWSCGHTIDGEETFPVEPESTGETETINCPMCGETFEAPPYRCPLCGEAVSDTDEIARAEEPVDEDTIEADGEMEVRLKSGWRAALIGMFLLPGFLHLYSLTQLYHYMGLCDAAGATANWRAWVAFGIDVVFLFLTLWLVRNGVIYAILSVFFWLIDLGWIF